MDILKKYLNTLKQLYGIRHRSLPSGATEDCPCRNLYVPHAGDILPRENKNLVLTTIVRFEYRGPVVGNYM